MNTVQAAKRAGISYRQLDHWWRKGYIGDGTFLGSGRTRELTRSQYTHLLRVAALVKAGFRPDQACKLIRRAQIDDDGALLIKVGKVHILVEDDQRGRGAA